jgi:hypothetical protein
MTVDFELKLATGKTIRWPGRDGEDACRRCTDCTGNQVVAWRPIRHGLFIGAPGPGSD